MMQASIFSTYSTGENRVTSSIMAVMQFLSLQRIERLFGAILEQPDFRFIHFHNQPSKGAAGVPDASISGRFRIIVETKIKRGTVKVDQLQRHLQRLDKIEPSQFLLVLTPDESRPLAVDQTNDPRVVWASFASLDQAIEEVLADNREVVSEREAFLLRHLQLMMVDEQLLANANDVVVIPARFAWPEYKNIHAYICQAERMFQPVKHMAFYSSNQIHELVPMIVESPQTVEFIGDKHQGKMKDVVNYFLDTHRIEEGDRLQVVLLSAPDAPETHRLTGPIMNNLKSESGRITAFTQNQRYVSLSRLMKAQYTSDLVDK